MSKKIWAIALLVQVSVFAILIQGVSPYILRYAVGAVIVLLDIAVYLDSKKYVLVLFRERPYIGVRQK